MTPLKFHSCLARQIECSISLRQLSGTDYQSQALLLCYFDRFLFEEKVEEPRLTLQITDRYLQTLAHLAPRVRYNRFCMVRQLCRYLSRTDPLTYVPEAIRAIPSRAAHRAYIYSKAEIGALLAAASLLPPSGSLRPHTCKTLLGLLYSTGIRIGEALALNLEDFHNTEQRLFIAEGKFHKARWVPLCASTCRALQSYLDRRILIRPHSPDSPLFLNLRSRRLHHCAVREARTHRKIGADQRANRRDRKSALLQHHQTAEEGHGEFFLYISSHRTGNGFVHADGTEIAHPGSRILPPMSSGEWQLRGRSRGYSWYATRGGSPSPVQSPNVVI